MDILKEELARFQKTADIKNIEMMFGRFVTLMDQMNAAAVYEELFAADDPDVSVEYESCGKYIGPDHVKAFMLNLHKRINNDKMSRGWLDFHDGGSPLINISKDGNTAEAIWTLISPKAKPASAEAEFSSKRKLTAFWQCGKMHWKLVKKDGEWKILSFHQLSFFTTEYHKGWVKQQECFRETPLWNILPDEKPRFYVYHPDQVYVQGGQYGYGPYVPDEEK